MMKKISSHTFKYTLRDIHKNTENRKFCFIIGAGASFKSGIPTGGELAEKWYKEIKERYSDEEIKQWEKDVKLNKKDLAAHYGSIYRKRFENDKTSGYEFLVQAMRTAKPTFGHIVLAQILTKAPGHCILTTNFDSLIETAIYQFTDQTPLVCGHESLSGYARPSKIHPLIIKLHRDLLLEPKSDPDEINKLAKGWKEPLDNIFSSHIPVVIGYGGNDGSLMSYFEQMNKPSNFFWCGLKNSPDSARIEKLITLMSGNYVEINGFDEIMQELLWVFDEIKPIEEELDEITKGRIEAVNKQLAEIVIESKKSDSDKGESKKELSAFEYSTMAINEPDYEKRKAIYQEALKKFPNTAWLWNAFTHFLQFVKKDYSDLEAYYLKALLVDPEYAANNGNYAIFLYKIKKDYENAEKYYLKALSLEPENAAYNGNYSGFLKDIKKEYKNAEKYILKALTLSPENEILIGNYATFLVNIKKDYEASEKYYLKALSIETENAIINGSYAGFLTDQKKDYENAEKYFLKALSLDPENAYINGYYAKFLFIKNRKEDATKYLDTAFRLNKDEKNKTLIVLWFLKYAHYFVSHDNAEQVIEGLLKEGIRSIGGDFSLNVKIGIENGHPYPEKLKELAIRITKLED
jgi:protein O-mannosyl-transferase